MYMYLYDICTLYWYDVILGGIFRVYIKFDEHYNVRPPDVCFHTIPFHPNGKIWKYIYNY